MNTLKATEEAGAGPLLNETTVLRTEVPLPDALC